ncbi:MAG TPA: hypothetical protein VKU85_15655, partial [bacterium]|nr:hypothetical protein [bacterium]
GLAAVAACVELGVLAREARLDARWDVLAERELTARADRIVGFLRDEGSRSLDQIREVGNDSDTRALLSSETALVRTARRPVFLDLMERFPSRGAGGVTIYDAEGLPRAWSGWSATATMSLAHEPSRIAEVVEIREGNIYTLLQVTHPILGDPPAGAADESRPGVGPVLGYVVYQEPLRVQFPLENRFLRVDDMLQRLEGGGGVRADVALELRTSRGDDIRTLRTAALKLDVREGSASATAAIVAAGGAPVGRVTLAGLSRPALVADRLQQIEQVRAWLLLAVAVLLVLRLWFLTEGTSVRGAVARLALVAGARAALLAWDPRAHHDFLGAFDPSVYALTRFAGLLRSPGDALLTAGAFALVAREVRRLLLAARPAVVAFARKHFFVSAVPAVASSLLVGSVAGLHWARTVNIARDANVPFYAGLDPFGSVPLAALELALLFGGVGFLLLGDALLSLGRALFARLPARLGATAVWGLAAFGSAVKVGASADGASLGQAASTFDSDLLRVAAALAALYAFHRVAALWRRPGPGAILATAVLAAVANYSAMLEAGEIRRRGLVELFAHDHVESPSNYRHFFLESMLDHFAQSTELRRVMEGAPGPENSNLAFIVWARSPLASVSAGCRVRIFDGDGTTLSTFSLGFPPELAEAYPDAPASGRPATRFRREEIGSTRVDVYSGSVTMERDSHRIGAVELSLAYFDDLRGPGPALPSVFTNLTAPDEYVQFAREVPDRIDRYRGESLVYSTDPEGGLGKRVPAFLVQALADSRQQGRWVERKIDDKLYDLYCVRERDGDVTIGYLTFGIERYGFLQAAGLLTRSVLVTLVLGVLLLV